MKMELNPAKLYRCVISPGIAEVCSNVKSMTGFFAPLNFEPEEALQMRPSSEICVTLLVKNDLLSRHSSTCLEFNNLSGEPGTDVLHYERTLFCSVKARMKLEKLCEHPTVTVNKNYYRFGKIRIGNFYPPGTHLRDILWASLIRWGYAPLHGVAFSTNGDAILVVGLPGVGKTRTLFQAITHGFQYLADELVIADSDGYLHACPNISSLAYALPEILDSFRAIKKGHLKARCLNFLSHQIPLAGSLLKWPYLAISSFIPQVEMVDKAKTHHIFILARGMSHVEKLPPRQAFRMIVAINGSELSFYDNPILHGYSLLNPWLNLSELRHAEEELLWTLVSNSNNFLCVAPKPDEYFSLIQEVIS